MFIIELQSNKIIPFIESNEEYEINIVESADQSSFTRSYEINEEKNIGNIYNTNINLSPAINEITQAQSLLVGNYKFNYYVNNFKERQIDASQKQLFNNEKNPDIITAILAERISKHTSIQNIKDHSLRGLKEDILIKNKTTPFDHLFYDQIDFIASNTIYNYDLGVFEKSTALNLLYQIHPIQMLINIWSHFIYDSSIIDFTHINYYLLRMYYPYSTDPYTFDEATLTLDVFNIREELQLKTIIQDKMTGLKITLNNQTNGYSEFLGENASLKMIDQIDPNIDDISNLTYIETSEIKSNGKIISKTYPAVKKVDAFVSFIKNGINLNYVKPKIDKRQEFMDFRNTNDEITKFIDDKNLSFWQNFRNINPIVANECILNMKNSLYNNTQYNINTDYSADSIIYKGFKE